jgi:hypothetical protein
MPEENFDQDAWLDRIGKRRPLDPENVRYSGKIGNDPGGHQQDLRK